MADPAEINRLLTLGGQECETLSDAAKAAEDVLDGLQREADALAETLEREGEEAHKHFQEVAERMEEAGDAAGGAGDDAKAALDAVVDKAGELKTNAAELLAGVQKGLEQLDAENERLSTDFEGETEANATALTSLGDKIQEVQTEVAARLQAIQDRVGQFTDDVDKTAGELLQKSKDTGEAMALVEEAGRNAAQQCLDAITALVQSQTPLLVNLCNRMIADHNEAVVKVRQAFTVDVTAKLAKELPPVKEVLEQLAELCAAEATELDQATTQLAERVGEVLELTARIEPLFPAASRLS